MPAIHFLDVTNRDGVQTARTGLSKFGKIMVNFYLGQLGVAQSELGFPFLFHEVPYVRACLALAVTRKEPVYTADRSWKNLRIGIPIHLIR